MVGPGASVADIRQEIFESFRENIDENDMDHETAEIILAHTLDDDPPYEFADQLIDDGG
jgi:hypothetical protein